MRATIKSSANLALNNILNNYSELLKVQNQLSSGRRVNTPSDDPLATNSAMRYDTILAKLSQYNKNISVGDSFLGMSDSSLSDVSNILISAKSLVVGSATDTTTAEMQESNAVEMNNLLQELVSIANRQEGSRYIFGGTETKTEPFSIVGSYVCYNGNENDINVMVDNNTKMAINVTGSESFGPLVSTVSTNNLNPKLNISPNTSTRLEDLNSGEGVASGSISIDYTSAPVKGLTIDLSSADTVEDVADIIEQASIDQADTYDPSDSKYNYVLKVELNSEKDGLRIVQWNRTTNVEVDLDTDPAASAISVDEVGANTVAADLGIKGDGTTFGLSVLEGKGTSPQLTENTLLSDLEGYENYPLLISNGSQTTSVSITESNDTQDSLGNWSLAGLSAGINCSDDGEFYCRVTDAGSGNYDVELYSGSEMTSNQLIASGQGTSGTVVLSSENDSGVSGTVSLNPSAVPSGGSLDFDLTADFGTTFQAVVDVPAFVEIGEDTAQAGFQTSDLVSNWHIQGLEQGVSTDDDGNLFVQIEDVGSGDYEVRLYRDAAHTDLVASGQLNDSTQGTVNIVGATGYEEVSGQVQIEWPPSSIDSVIGAGPHDMTLTATFNTVGDLMNGISNSNTYTYATINDDGTGIDISSRLSGAYLTVGQSVSAAAHCGDDAGQLSQIDLNGLAVGVNSDYEGKVYAEVVDSSGAGTGPYTVNLYSDSDRSELVASGSITGTNGIVALEEENDSGLSGSIYLEYSADDANIEILSQPVSTLQDENNQVSQVDISGLTPGVNCDYHGNVYAEVVDNGSGSTVVRLYKDAKHTIQIAEGTIAGTSGVVTLNEVNGSGIGTATNPASLYVNYVEDDTDIVIGYEPSGITGQVREDNIFSTFSDVVDAMHAGDTEGLSDLISSVNADIDRVLLARADVGARQQRLELLENRHDDETLNFTSLKSNEIDLDFAEATVRYQEMTNTYEAALRITAQIIPMSLVDYL